MVDVQQWKSGQQLYVVGARPKLKRKASASCITNKFALVPRLSPHGHFHNAVYIYLTFRPKTRATNSRIMHVRIQRARSSPSFFDAQVLVFPSRFLAFTLCKLTTVLPTAVASLRTPAVLSHIDVKFPPRETRPAGVSNPILEGRIAVRGCSIAKPLLTICQGVQKFKAQAR